MAEKKMIEFIFSFFFYFKIYKDLFWASPPYMLFFSFLIGSSPLEGYSSCDKKLDKILGFLVCLGLTFSVWQVSFIFDFSLQLYYVVVCWAIHFDNSSMSCNNNKYNNNNNNDNRNTTSSSRLEFCVNYANLWSDWTSPWKVLVDTANNLFSYIPSLISF